MRWQGGYGRATRGHNGGEVEGLRPLPYGTLPLVPFLLCDRAALQRGVENPADRRDQGREQESSSHDYLLKWKLPPTPVAGHVGLAPSLAAFCLK